MIGRIKRRTKRRHSTKAELEWATFQWSNDGIEWHTIRRIPINRLTWVSKREQRLLYRAMQEVTL